MSSTRFPLSVLLTSLAPATSACELVADFDRDKITEANTKPPEQLPMIPVPPEQRPPPVDAGDGGPPLLPDSGLPDSGAEVDAGMMMDGGPVDDAGLDAEAGDAQADDASVDAGDASL